MKIKAVKIVRCDNTIDGTAWLGLLISDNPKPNNRFGTSCSLPVWPTYKFSGSLHGGFRTFSGTWISRFVGWKNGFIGNILTLLAVWRWVASRLPVLCQSGVSYLLKIRLPGDSSAEYNEEIKKCGFLSLSKGEIIKPGCDTPAKI